ncbi:MAG: cytidylate kinase-like family protein, partial [Saprospiraceae bacterium]|nr:cytidylate kinase-like family protein [Saprospiraceae bacterium]
SLARELGKRIGFKVWDRELLSAIAEEAKADEQLLASLDERRRKMIDDAVYGSLMGSQHSNTQYYRSLMRVVHTIGAHGRSIIVGRGSNYILEPEDALRVRIVRPFEERVQHMMNVEGMSEKDAQKLVKTRDAERDDFVRHYFKRDPADTLSYDLVLNAGVFNTGELAELTLLAYEKKIGKLPSPAG